MARKSNKTAHVLNLLAGHDAQPATDETTDTTPVPEAADETPQTSAASESSPVDAEIVSTSAPSQNISVIDTTGEDPLADLIQQKLSAQFDAAEPSEASDVDTEPSDVSDVDAEPDKTDFAAATVSKEVPAAKTSEPLLDEASAADTAPDSSTNAATETSAQASSVTENASFSMEAASDNVSVPSPEPVPDPEPVSVPSPEPIPSVPVPESIPGPGPTSVPKTEPELVPEPEPDFAYINIMESIVKDKIIYFMRQFDVCTCERCVADTIALTLNGLAPKYVVTSPAAVDPLISYYTNRLISDVTVEATKACMVIKDNPRH